MFYESDKILGMRYRQAVRFLDKLDLWDEVAGIVTDEHGEVIAVWH